MTIADTSNRGLAPLRAHLSSWRLHLAVLAIALVAELIGVRTLQFWVGTVLFLPLLYAFVLGVLANPNVVAPARRLLGASDGAVAGRIIVIALLPFLAKFGTLVGGSIETVVEAGPALVLQELGNLGTIVLGLPIAIFLLRMGREAVGASFSIAREGSLALVADKYGLKSPEGTGVMGVYVVGTLVGTFVFSILASLAHATGLFDPRALAMACGVGSGSMTAACGGTLALLEPAAEAEILALAGASNLLTTLTGLYVAIFVSLPLTDWAYRKLTGTRAVARPGTDVV
ncbi:DUF3100 domain-containing protein [Salinarimonas chemoclinalis]|uniref:DUF3100 domain-containing protein n=1 Tax=Salinarimonas chemoclinalis TaxID=3241599 RepID=UPI0035576C80